MPMFGGDPMGYTPYNQDELNTLQGLIATPDASSVPPATYPTPVNESLTLDDPQAPPAAAPPTPITAPPAIAAPPDIAPPPGVNVNNPLPPMAPALDLSTPQLPASPRGLVKSEYSTSGVPDAERDKLMSLHQQLADQQSGAIDTSAHTEQGILQDRDAAHAKRIGTANVEVNKAQMALNGQQAARQKLEQEGADWSRVKETPAKAFDGIEWAGVLGAIGSAAGVFANAMGWQHGNPVGDAFDTHVQRSIAAQRDQKNSRLSQIEARIGDRKAAESLLSAQLHDAIATRTAEEASRATDGEAQKRLGSLVEEERAKVKEGVLGAYERLVPKEEQKFAPPKPAGAGGDKMVEHMAKLAELDKSLEERGAGLDNPLRQAIRKELQGFSGKSAPEQAHEETASKDAAAAAAANAASSNLNEDQGKAEAAHRTTEEFYQQSGLVRDPNTKQWVVGAGSFPPSLLEDLKSASTMGGTPTPIRDKARSARQALGRLMSGAKIGEKDEMPEFQELLGQDTQTRAQLASRANAVDQLIESRRKASTVPDAALAPSREMAGFRPSKK